MLIKLGVVLNKADFLLIYGILSALYCNYLYMSYIRSESMDIRAIMDFFKEYFTLDQFFRITSNARNIFFYIDHREHDLRFDVDLDEGAHDRFWDYFIFEYTHLKFYNVTLFEHFIEMADISDKERKMYQNCFDKNVHSCFRVFKTEKEMITIRDVLQGDVYKVKVPGDTLIKDDSILITRIILDKLGCYRLSPGLNVIYSGESAIVANEVIEKYFDDFTNNGFTALKNELAFFSIYHPLSDDVSNLLYIKL